MLHFNANAFTFSAVIFLFYNWMFLDYSKGFGGKYGVQADRVDQSALGWDHQEKLSAHASQKGCLCVCLELCALLTANSFHCRF